MSLQDDIRRAVHESLSDDQGQPRPMAKGELAREIAESFEGREGAPSLDEVLAIIDEMEANGEVRFVGNTVHPPV